MVDCKDRWSGMMKMSILEARAVPRPLLDSPAFGEVFWCKRSREEVKNCVVRAWEKYIFVETPTRRRRRWRGSCEEDIVAGFCLNSPGQVCSTEAYDGLWWCGGLAMGFGYV